MVWERNYSFDAQISVLVNSAACPSFGIGHRSLVRRTDRPMKLLKRTYRPLGHFNRPGQFGDLSLSRRKRLQILVYHLDHGLQNTWSLRHVGERHVAK